MIENIINIKVANVSTLMLLPLLVSVSEIIQYSALIAVWSTIALNVHTFVKSRKKIEKDRK